MSLELERAYFSHSILENDFFSRLAEPVEVWKKSDYSIEERSDVLSRNWQQAMERTESIKWARQTWSAAENIGVRALAQRLHHLGASSKSFKATDEYPSWQTVSTWLDDIDRFLAAVEAAGYKYDPGQNALARQFWLSGLALYEFVQGLKHGSPRFHQYFKVSI